MLKIQCQIKLKVPILKAPKELSEIQRNLKEFEGTLRNLKEP